MLDSEFWILKEIGAEVGASSHKMGKWLVELEYRDLAKEPTHKAWHEGMCEQRRDESGHFQVVWHKRKVLKALEDAGFIPARQHEAAVSESEVKMIGPFEMQKTTGGGVEIVNRQGNVVCVSYWPDCGGQIVSLLNIAHELGKFRE
jgi:hypothetical protein